MGPLLAAALLSGAGLTPDGVILASVAPGIVAVAVVVWAMRGTGNGKRGTGKVEPGPAPDLVVSDPPRSSPFVFLLVVLFSLARFPETLLLLRLQDLRLSVALVPLVWAGLHVIRTFGSYPG
ncbi:MAG: hypothetical protein HYW06_02045, partial [Gemmatimonadetes bacterium]|nr:hypothetical protein [Gemmatimonadota bacterium]